MAEPIPPSPAESLAVIANPSATICDQMVNTLLKMPVLFWRFIASTFNSDLTLTTSFLKKIRSPGEISIFAWARPETGWLLCNGQEVVIATYPDLYAVIGITYGTPASVLNFKVPDLRDRFPLGANAAGIAVLAATGGEQNHTLLTAELPSHDHDIPCTSYPGDVSGTETILTDPPMTGPITKSTAVEGGGQAHNNMPPYLGLNFYIKT